LPKDGLQSKLLIAGPHRCGSAQKKLLATKKRMKAETKVIEDLIIRFILATYPRAHQKGLDSNTLLLENGVVDSIGVLELVGFLETEFGVAVADEDLNADNFRTVAQIGAFVQAKQGTGDAV